MKRRLCYNCFQEKHEEGACPFCGFDLAENEKKYPVALRAGTVLNDRYIIGRVLGQGGFGITYLAYDRKLRAKVAVKEFMPNDIATRIGTTVSVAMESRTADFTYGAERFREEARTLAKFMGQPGIAGVTDYFDENDTSYFVMDYIEGISFKTYIANQGGKISVEEALNVMIPVLRALTAVHAEGFIHRDVTPDNIYITKDGNIKLLDFGSARYSLGDKSKSLDVILKVGYAPKEQYIRRGRQGPYTDVYSCAACLYAALTGYLPPESLERLDQDTLVPPSQAGVELPLYLERAILKGLEVQPEDRFQSAAEFLEALESQQVTELSWDMEEEAEPTDSSALARTGKKRSTIFLGGAVAALVLIGVVFGVFGLSKSSQGSSDTDVVMNADRGDDIQAGGASSAGDVQNAAEIAAALAPKVVIAGTEYSTALEELTLEVTPLSEEDYRNLEEMRDLTRLKISFPDGMGIDDLTPFSGLNSLETLELDTHGLGSLEGLEQLGNLVHLQLWGDGAYYDSLEPVGGLTKLETLRLPVYDRSIMRAADISPLANCTELRELDLDYKVANLEPLENLTKLTSLHLSDGYYGFGQSEVAASLEPLRGLTNLVALSIRNEEIRDLSGLEGMQQLETLTLDVDQLEDISALQDLGQLKTVRINFSYENRIQDMSPLDHVPNKRLTYGR